jgi:hypothetical protein
MVEGYPFSLCSQLGARTILVLSGPFLVMTDINLISYLHEYEILFVLFIIFMILASILKDSVQHDILLYFHVMS